MRTLNKPVPKTEPRMGVPAKALETLVGREGRRAVTILFFLLPQRISFLYNEIKACKIKICLMFKGTREDTYLTFPSSQNLCTMPIPFRSIKWYQETEWD